MNVLAPFLVMISVALACFTAPDGNGVWVNASEVVSVSHGLDCAVGSHSKIQTSNGYICVQETPQQVLKVLEIGK